jgi:hypothetical protein
VGNLRTRTLRKASLTLDLTFDGLIPAIGSDGQGAEGRGASADARKIVGKGHLEQAGRWSGFIAADGARCEFGAQARGNRDKSWGPRRWGGPTMWRWFSINIGDDVHFGGSASAPSRAISTGAGYGATGRTRAFATGMSRRSSRTTASPIG